MIGKSEGRLLIPTLKQLKNKCSKKEQKGEYFWILCDQTTKRTNEASLRKVVLPLICTENWLDTRSSVYVR